jgi:hypothetical protein
MRACLLALALAGCHTASGFIGDAKQPVELAAVAAVGGQLVPVTSGARLPLTAVAGGGWTLFAGVRARNLSQTVSLSAQLLDWQTGQKLMSDTRTVSLHVAADGWGETGASDLSQFATLTACPNFSAHDLDGQPVQLMVTVSDSSQPPVVGTQLATIYPTCPAGDARCHCECEANFTFGKCTAVDAAPDL